MIEKTIIQLIRSGYILDVEKGKEVVVFNKKQNLFLKNHCGVHCALLNETELIDWIIDWYDEFQKISIGKKDKRIIMDYED